MNTVMSNIWDMLVIIKCKLNIARMRIMGHYITHRQFVRVRAALRKDPGCYTRQEIEVMKTEAGQYLKDQPLWHPIAWGIYWFANRVAPLLFPFGTVIIR